MVRLVSDCVKYVVNVKRAVLGKRFYNSANEKDCPLGKFRRAAWVLMTFSKEKLTVFPPSDTIKGLEAISPKRIVSLADVS